MLADSKAAVGILSIGALGVAFHHYLTAHSTGPAPDAVFMVRRAARERWRQEMTLGIETETGRRDLSLSGILGGTLPEASAAGRLPGIVLVCTNPDQLFEVVADYVAVVEDAHAQGRLGTDSDGLPLLVLCANGIYFQRIRSTFVDLLEESTMLGRLPDLWPALMPRIVGRLMRGVTIQTSLRRGSGHEAIYRPGPPGRTLLAGGDPTDRKAAACTLTRLGGWFEDAGNFTPTRVEFNKALVNLASNVFGQLAAIDGNGEFHRLTVGEIAGPLQQIKIRGLVEAVMRVGRGVGVYQQGESSEELFKETVRWQAISASHVPSSLQWLEQQIAARTLGEGLAPTEKWLLQPLQHYARSLSDAEAIDYFETIERDLLAAIARAAAFSRNRTDSLPSPVSD